MVTGEICIVGKLQLPSMPYVMETERLNESGRRNNALLEACEANKSVISGEERLETHGRGYIEGPR